MLLVTAFFLLISAWRKTPISALRSQQKLHRVCWKTILYRGVAKPACRWQAFRTSCNRNRNCSAKKMVSNIQKPCIYT